MEKAGKLKRTHGGAIPADKASFELNSARKKIVNSHEKQLIAAYCSSLIEDGDTIALDCGSTSLALAKYLTQKKGLTVITNDIHIAAYLEKDTSCNVIVIGGTLRHGFECTVGPIALSILKKLNVDKAFLGANAFSITRGFTTPDINQAEIKKALILSAVKKFVLCDSSKFGKTSFVKFASVDDIDHLITGQNIPEYIQRYFHEQESNIQFTMI